MPNNEEKYNYNRFGSKGKRVGQAVLDILSNNPQEQTVQDTIDSYKGDFDKAFHDAVENGIKQKLTYPFYVLVLQNKEFWAENVVRNWFVARQTAPFALDMIQQYPHHNKILYMVHPETNMIHICWNIPGYEDCRSILKNPIGIDPKLLGWIKDALAGKLECDSFDNKNKVCENNDN